MANNNSVFCFNSPLFTAPTTPQSRQRMSVEDSTEKLVQDIRDTLGQLSHLWNQINMDNSSREIRIQTAYEYVHTLLRDIVSSEEQMIRNVGTDLESRRKTLAELRRLFKQPLFDESSYPKGSIALLRALDAEVNRLTKKREDAMDRQLSFLRKYESLCHRLGIKGHHVEGINERILEEGEVAQLSDRIQEARTLFAKRLDKALQVQSEAKKIYDSIQLPINNSIGEEELHCLRVDLQSHSVVLSQELLNKMSSLNQRLKDHYDAWIEQVAFRYDELLVKLDSLAAKCFRPPVSKEYPANLNPERLSGKELEKLEEELHARQELYERARPVFDKLNEWMESWKQKLDAERRVCRASFYKNRAGSLNAKLKQRRAVEQKVPKLFNELNELCEEYVMHNPVYDILVEGMRADQYAESVMHAYGQDREVQRAQKQLSSTTSRRPMTPGRPTTTATPPRRNVFASTTPNPAAGRTAMRALYPYNKQAPATVIGPRSTRKRSFSCSQLSAIYPLKVATMSPRTSSPKPGDS